MIVKVSPNHRNTIKRFNDDGVIDDILQSFFDKFA